VTIFNLDATSGSLQSVTVTGSDNEVTTSADVVHVVSAMSDSRPVMWTYVYPGTASLSNVDPLAVHGPHFQNFLGKCYKDLLSRENHGKIFSKTLILH